MELLKLTEQVRIVAKKAGDYIAASRLTFTDSQVSAKGVNDFVTEIDKGSERIIVEELQKILPEAGFITEEDTIIDRKKLSWIIDPLDGTTNFIHGFPCFCVSIALVDDKEVLLGVIYEVNLKESFWAYKNGGAFLNEKPIQVSKRLSLSESLIATGFPYSNFKRMNAYLELFKHLMHSTHGLRRPGSAAADLAYVACGRVDSFYEYGLKPWDVAAGICIILEAGGRINDFKGLDNYLFGEEILATNGSTHDEFLILVKKYFHEC